MSAPFSSSPPPVPVSRVAAGAVFGADLGAVAERCGAEHQEHIHHLVIHTHRPALRKRANSSLKLTKLLNGFISYIEAKEKKKRIETVVLE